MSSFSPVVEQSEPAGTYIPDIVLATVLVAQDYHAQQLQPVLQSLASGQTVRPGSPTRLCRKEMLVLELVDATAGPFSDLEAKLKAASAPTCRDEFRTSFRTWEDLEHGREELYAWRDRANANGEWGTLPAMLRQDTRLKLATVCLLVSLVVARLHGVALQVLPEVAAALFI